MNPRAAVNDLLPFQGSPFGQLGYFSKLSYTIAIFAVIYPLGIIKMPNGEGGIRTHAPLRTNGFQDRLVMTTSIPLQLIFHTDFVSAKCILPSLPFSVNILF